MNFSTLSPSFYIVNAINKYGENRGQFSEYEKCLILPGSFFPLHDCLWYTKKTCGSKTRDNS